MKKIVLILVTLLFSSALLLGQDDEERNVRIPLIGEKAPSFHAVSTNGDLVFPDDFGGRWKILLSHPMDYTPVCSSELLELAYHQQDFDRLHVRLAVVSTNDLDTHKAWKEALEGIEYKGHPTVRIKFPIVEDESRVISRQYGMIHPAISGTKSVRGVFIIDPDDVVRSVSFYPLNVGRSVEEILRAVTALQTADDVMMTPSDWHMGDDLIVAVPPVTDQSIDNVPEGYYRLAWFLWFQKALAQR